MAKKQNSNNSYVKTLNAILIVISAGLTALCLALFTNIFNSYAKDLVVKNENGTSVARYENIDKVKWSSKSISFVQRDGSEMILMMKEGNTYHVKTNK